ncbi:MAG: GAF domain-containing sensor histidine kinase [Chloroflexi bacterium]|nr:GAF domain-containing sensor histidine kinase [Chloroflexota bacterium]
MPSLPRRRKSDFDPAANEWFSQVTRLEQKVAALEALQEVARCLTSELNLDQLLAQILSSAVQVMRASAGSLLLFDPATNELVFKVVQGGLGDALLNQRFPSDRGIAGSVFTHQKPSIVHDVNTDDRFLSIGDGATFSAHSLIAVPLIHQGKAIGVLELLNKKSGDRFNSDDQELLLAFASQSAIAIENARLYQQVVFERDRILVVEEQVRRELARDLHDGPSQLLSAIIMNLRFLREVIARKPAEAKGELDSVEQLATQALHQVRNMLFDLRPVVLETQGLPAALQTYVDRQRESKDLQIHLETDAFNVRLDPKQEAAIFSIIQEAVGNVRKHAQAKNVWIQAQQAVGALTICIQDDGCGFDVPAVEAVYAQRGSLGLLNMKERAEIAHARLRIDSAPGKGTLVKLVVPLARVPVF